MEEQRLNLECKYFNGNKPCIYNLTQGLECQCKYFEKIRKRLLIIQTGTLSDIIRMTSILPIIRKHHDNYLITWATSIEGTLILKNNPYIDRVVPFKFPDIEIIKKIGCDTLICFDTNPGIVSFSDDINTTSRYGYTIGKTGVIVPCNKLGYLGYNMMIDRKAKTENMLSVQDIYMRMLGFKEEPGECYVPMTSYSDVVDVCLNMLGDNVTQEWLYWKDLEFLLRKEGISFRVQESRFKNPTDYISWINLGKIVVSVNTLGLDLAIALRKSVIAILGANDININIYGRGVKLYDKTLECINCGRYTCNSLECFRRIKAETVVEEIKKLLHSQKESVK